MMLKKIAIVAGLGLALSATAEAQAPRKGGTIRMTAPYGSSFSSMDIHTTPRAQDEIYAKGLHRSLYNWDSAEGKPIPELADAVAVVVRVFSASAMMMPPVYAPRVAPSA